MATPQFYVNVEAAIFKGDEWLMIERSKKEAHAAGMLSMVGGTVELDDSDSDTLEEALHREVSEEVDIQLNARLRYVESKKFVSDVGSTVLDIVFMAEYMSGSPKPVDPNEVGAVKWMKFDAIVQDPLTPPWIIQSMKKAEKLRKDISK